MPHIKVAPFNIKELEKLDFISFYGRNINNEQGEIFLVEKQNSFICFDIIKKDKEFLIKPNKITKNSNIKQIKKILNSIAKELKLDIIYSNININTKAIKPKEEFLKRIEDFYNFKTIFKKIKIEIGFGSGRHLLYKAKKEPNTLFIGVEIYTPSINQVLKQIRINNLKNIYIINYDARLLLEMLPSNILDKIYIHFPVPWDKKPHRRVINKEFVNEAIRVLKKGDSIELRTDSIKYFIYSLDIFSSFNKVKFLVEKNRDIEVISKYEQRWKKMNKDIYTINFYSLIESSPKELDIDFTFDFDINLDIKGEFLKKPIVKDGFFVHFGSFFKSYNDSKYLAEVAFGNFNMPERKFLYIKNSSCKYLPSNPVKSVANYKAHKLIKEVLKNG